jgi:Family of unknown function (DUF6152)
MKRNLATSSALAIGLLIVSNSVFAHHGISTYDLARTITLTGTISDFDWANPHCLVHMDVKDDRGDVRHWTLELASTYTMSRRGWIRDSLKPGDRVAAETHPARNGTTIGISATAKYVLRFVVNGKAFSYQ